MSDKACPRCGAETGYYKKKAMKYNQLYDFKDEAIDFIDKETIGGKIKYCIVCDKDITNYVTGETVK